MRKQDSCIERGWKHNPGVKDWICALGLIPDCCSQSSTVYQKENTDIPFFSPFAYLQENVNLQG